MCQGLLGHQNQYLFHSWGITIGFKGEWNAVWNANLGYGFAVQMLMEPLEGGISQRMVSGVSWLWMAKLGHGSESEGRSVTFPSQA